MALYKDLTYLAKSTDSAFDTLHRPGSTCPHSGIYRCKGCGDEIASNKGNPFPPQNHHQHKDSSAVEWRLIVRSQSQK